MTKQEAREQLLATLNKSAEEQFKATVMRILLDIRDAQQKLTSRKQELAKLEYVAPTLPEIEE